jgi:hypothetical protein
MWLLQRKNLHKKHLLWLKIIALCLVAHGIILFWIFCVYNENKYMHAFTVNKKIDYSAPIVFKYLTPVQNTISVPQRTTTTKQTAPTPKTIAKPVTEKPVTEMKTSVQTKPTTIATQPKTEINQKPLAKSEKKIIPAEPAKPIVPKKLEENKIAKALDIQQNLEPATTKPESSSSAQQPPANAQISHDFREAEALRCGAQLQKELVQQWHPPIGVSPDCACDISFFVNKQGKIEQLKMVKSSGVMMFDISARQALFSMKMPQWTYGKPLVINFKQ